MLPHAVGSLARVIRHTSCPARAISTGNIQQALRQWPSVDGALPCFVWLQMFRDVHTICGIHNVKDVVVILINQPYVCNNSKTKELITTRGRMAAIGDSGTLDTRLKTRHLPIFHDVLLLHGRQAISLGIVLFPTTCAAPVSVVNYCSAGLQAPFLSEPSLYPTTLSTDLLCDATVAVLATLVACCPCHSLSTSGRSSLSVGTIPLKGGTAWRRSDT